MGYIFTTESSKLIVTLNTNEGELEPNIKEYSAPSLVLGNDRIYLKENGTFVQNFILLNIEEIDGDTPLNLADAYELLENLIRNLFVVSSGGVEPAYKVYTALLSQSGTDAPTAIVLENTLENTVVGINYIDEGFYYIEFENNFDLTKTVIDIANTGYNPTPTGIQTNNIIIFDGEENLVYLKTFSYGETQVPSTLQLNNNSLFYTKIEIRVYN